VSYQLLELSLYIEKPATCYFLHVPIERCSEIYTYDEEIGLGQTIRYVLIQRILFIAYKP
jgi:hypothetical protein